MKLLSFEFTALLLLSKVVAVNGVNETQIWQQVAKQLSGFSSDTNIDIKSTDTDNVADYIKNWKNKLTALYAANGDCLVTSDADGQAFFLFFIFNNKIIFSIRQYPSLFTDMHGDKRSQGCELCEGGNGYPYKFICKNGGWEKVMCENSTFCTEMGRCQAECQPYGGELIEVNCSKYLKTNKDWPITQWDILLLSVYVLEERHMFDRDVFKINFFIQIPIYILSYIPMIIVLIFCLSKKIPFTLKIFALNSVLLNGVCLTISLLKLISDKIWITKALQAYQDANVKASCLSAKYVTWHESTDSIPNVLVSFDSYLKTAFQWSVYSTSVSFFFLRLTSYLACVHPLLFNKIVNVRNSLISVICSDIFPLPVLFCLQYFVFNQGIKYYLIIEIIFEGIVFFFEITATLFAFMAYAKMHYKLKALLTDKSDINALGAALIQSICPNIILFVFFIYDLNKWYLPIYKEKVDARINEAFGNYNTDDDHFYTFLKNFEILMEFSKKYITLLKPFTESILILFLMPPFRNEILFYIRKLPWLKKDEVQQISQTSVNAILIGFK